MFNRLNEQLQKLPTPPEQIMMDGVADALDLYSKT